MPELKIGKTIKQAKPQLAVTNRLKAGKYRFRLVVVDTSGNVSKPDELIVTVRRRQQTPVPPVVFTPVLADPVVLNPRRVTPVAVTPGVAVRRRNLTAANLNNLNLNPNRRRPR